MTEEMRTIPELQEQFRSDLSDAVDSKVDTKVRAGKRRTRLNFGVVAFVIALLLSLVVPPIGYAVYRNNARDDAQDASVASLQQFYKLVQPIVDNLRASAGQAPSTTSPGPVTADDVKNLIDQVPEPQPGKPGKDGESIVGPPGPAGPQGDPGQSIVGPKGDQGDKGDPGESVTGPQGPAGDSVAGPAGQDGAAGRGVMSMTFACQDGALVATVTYTDGTTSSDPVDGSTVCAVATGG